MNEFAKQKIAFSVAFLAVLFSTTPVLEIIGDRGFFIFHYWFSLNHLYYFLSGVFALSVYAFGIQFISERGIRYVAEVGNTLYVFAITAPAAYLLLFIIVKLFEALSTKLPAAAITIISSVASSIVGAMVAILTSVFQKKLNQKEKDATTEQLSREEALFMKRAQELLRARHYDLAVVEAFKSIEVAARKALLERGQYFAPNKWVTLLSQKELLPKELIIALNRIREVRNMAAHGVEPVSAEVAKECIPLATRIVAALSSQEDIT